MIIELAIGVPTWIVVRFITLSLILTTLLSRVWTNVTARRAGVRVSSGVPVRLRPRPYNRGSLVQEEDGEDRRFRGLLLITVALTSADLMMEFGSASVERPTGELIDTGYSRDGFDSFIGARISSNGTWEPTRMASHSLRATYEVWYSDEAAESGYKLTGEDLEILGTKSRASSYQQVLLSRYSSLSPRTTGFP
ncbi:unnamed protein product [Chondrus crispus]|uniref:Uncharacterized protein n=1 Tax=Chondrus crispus TaxID=2769 RepID=R7QFM1_CHOCR|nr:unnamed protein product [Chondrus crispus]CDF37327.1 unnamed protein product [Chondrus crispus]|eukprot:XP_005717146.1 unnamed protein product [Chondrus crispus]